MARQLFGTDGIRGVAGEYPLDRKTVYAVGRALGRWANRHAVEGGEAEVLIGIDTRESGPWIARLLAAALAETRVSTHYAGLITTPGVAYLTKTGPFAAGIMVSASHNPYQDNGIKVFGHTGYKLPDEEEHAIEEMIFALLEEGIAESEQEVAVEGALDETYLEHLASTLPQGARREERALRIVLDCGHGAASPLAPALFRRLGAEVDARCVQPDGRNINLDCGALHVDNLARIVRETEADLGFAFDGDADRCIAVAPSGRVVDGDMMLMVCARRMNAAGRLAAGDGTPTVVATVMSNLGLEKLCAREGIRLVRTPVGDKYVLEEMMRRGAHVGGEQSGHVIFHDHATTGDGMLSALRIVEAVAASGQSLDELTADFISFPQTLKKVKVRSKPALEEIPSIASEIEKAERSLGDEGRIVVRYSGTEPVARVMIEGPSQGVIEAHADRIINAIRAELG
ncbi:MAG: phosphoglucosamine mutase [Bryobacterales bacterium]|nr:phosphoglucosamine mutase [Bryobacterales bacterium]